MDLSLKDYVVILQCHIVKERCPGYFCEKAFHERTGGFADYPRNRDYRTLSMTCGGCCGQATHRKLSSLLRKLEKEEAISRRRVVVQLSSCITKHNHHSPPCPHLGYLLEILSHLEVDVRHDTMINPLAEERRKSGKYCAEGKGWFLARRQVVIAERGKVVSIDYTLKNSNGEVLDTSQGREPLAYLHGANNLLPGLAAALEGHSPGDRLTAVIEPDQAYGMRDEHRVGKIPRSNLEGIGDLSVGTQLRAQTDEGPRIVVVTDMDDESVTLDANHPLAGETLHFDITVGDIRDATPEEVMHGYAQVPDNHPR